MTKVLVTGGFGFIGSHIVDTLIRNNYEVAVYDNLSTGSMQNVESNVMVFIGNIEDKETLGKAIETFEPDYVIHEAAQVSVQNSISDISNDAHINIVGTINLIELSLKYAVKKIVFASSAAVYGNTDTLPILVSHPIQPLSPYGTSKKTAEEYLMLAKELFDLEYVILRYSNVYGPRQSAGGEGGVISILTQHSIHNERPVIYGDGLQTRDFVYVEDVASANLQALKFDGSGIFNISSTTSSSINQLYSIIQSISQNDIHPIYKSTKSGDIKASLLCNKMSIQKLNWQPKYLLPDGLLKTYEYYLKRNQSTTLMVEESSNLHKTKNVSL